MYRGGRGSKKSFLSGDIGAPGLINEELQCAMSFYYEKVRGEDELVWGLFLQFKALLEERGAALSRSYLYNGPPRKRRRVDIIIILKSS